MNTIQESILNMAMVCDNFLSANEKIISPLPTANVSAATIKEIIAKINTVAQLQNYPKKGIADNKNELRANLCILTVDTSRKLFAFSKFTSNSILMSEVKVTATELEKLASFKLKAKAQQIYDQAQLLLSELEAYEISESTQANLLAAINNFNQSIPLPQIGRDDTKYNTTLLKNLFNDLKKTLSNLDAAIDIIRLINPSFYNSYKMSRKINNTNKSYLSLKAKIYDSLTNEPIKNATASFVLNGNAEELLKSNTLITKNVLTKISAEKGGINVKNIKAGTYAVLVSKSGYENKVVNAYITNGECCLLNIKLNKVS